MKHLSHRLGALVGAIMLCLLSCFATAPVLAASAKPAKAQDSIGFSSPYSPSAVSCGGSLIFWTDADSTLKMVYPPIDITDDTQYDFSDHSSRGPTVTCFHGHPYVAFVANDSSHSIHVGYFDRSACGPVNLITSISYCNLQGGVTIPGQATGLTPAIGVNGNTLYVAWHGIGNNNITIEQSTDGQHWGGRMVLNPQAVQSIDAPSLTSAGGNLYIGWPGTDRGHHLNIGIYIEGASTPFFTQILGSDSTLVSFGIAGEANGNIAAIWKSSNSTTLSTATYDGNVNDWHPRVLAGATSNVAPTVVTGSSGTTVHYVYIGTNGAINLY